MNSTCSCRLTKNIPPWKEKRALNVVMHLQGNRNAGVCSYARPAALRVEEVPEEVPEGVA